MNRPTCSACRAPIGISTGFQFAMGGAVLCPSCATSGPKLRPGEGPPRCSQCNAAIRPGTGIQHPEAGLICKGCDC